MDKPPAPPEPRRERARSALLMGLLFLVAVLGPAVAFAGVTIVWPASPHTVDVISDPPLAFSEGADYATADALGFAGDFTLSDNDAAFSVTLSGLSGGTIVIDRYANVTKSAAVDSFKVEVASAISGTLTAPTELKLRLWTGLVAPTGDSDPQVCAVLDLTAAQGTESADGCSADADLQVVYTLPTNASGSSTVSIRPSSIAFA